MYLKPRLFFWNKNNSSSLLVIKGQEIPNHDDKWRNQEGLKSIQPPFAKILETLTPKFKGLNNQKNSKLSQSLSPPQIRRNSPKIGEDQQKKKKKRKKVFAVSWSVSSSKSTFPRNLVLYSARICRIYSCWLALFRLIIQRSNLDGGTPKSRVPPRPLTI